jgi:hypothetical protein
VILTKAAHWLSPIKPVENATFLVASESKPDDPQRWRL